MMDSFIEGDVWRQFSALRGDKSQRIVAAVAYVTDRTRIPWQVGDLLACDAEPASIRACRTSAKVLLELVERGVDVYSVPKLHAKVLVSGQFAAIGSANMSENSAGCLVEATYVTDRGRVRAQVRDFIERRIKGRSPLTRDQLVRLDALPKVPKPPSQKSHAKRTAWAGGEQVWLIRTSPYDMDRPGRAAEKLVVEETMRQMGADLDWIRNSANSNVARRAKVGDWVIQMHGKRGSSRLSVCEPTRIVSRQDTGAWNRIYLASADESKLTFAELNHRLKRAGLSPLGQSICRVATDEQIAELKRYWRRLSQ